MTFSVAIRSRLGKSGKIVCYLIALFFIAYDLFLGILVPFETDIKRGQWQRPFSLLMALLWFIFLMIIWRRSISRLSAIIFPLSILVIEILGTYLTYILTA